MQGRHGIGHSTNLVGRPSDLLASCEFNENPAPLCIWGVREMNRSLFDMLAQAGDLHEAGEAFSCYMMAMFGIDPEQQEKAGKGAGRRRFRSSFLRLIEGWGYDSNSPEGAVLKGWVESRFGICPSYHKEIIERDSTARLDHLCGGEDVEPLPQQRDLGSARPAFRVLPMGDRALCLSGANACDAIPGGQRVRRAPDRGARRASAAL